MTLFRSVFVFFSVYASSSFAAFVTIQNPCAQEAWLQVEVADVVGQSIGKITVEVLEQSKLPFVGSEGGISSIQGTPVSEKSLEIVSDKEMRAYGWCYLVDGFKPSLMPDQLKVSQADSQIVWFFGYAQYLNGQWVTMCTPTVEQRPSFICGH